MLFVALTRERRQVTLLTVAGQESRFVVEPGCSTFPLSAHRQDRRGRDCTPAIGQAVLGGRAAVLKAPADGVARMVGTMTAGTSS